MKKLIKREEKRRGYGCMPKVLGSFDLEIPEVMCYLYLPIKMAGSHTYRIPPNLSWIRALLGEVEVDKDDYVYVTVKNLYEQKGSYGNRSGWHSDGFKTDDISYIWAGSSPTEFAFKRFYDISDCHTRSMEQFEEQMRGGGYCSFIPKLLLKLDQAVIHRTPLILEEGFRQFIKISVSKNKYDLKGNSHNYGFNYNWGLTPRDIARNCPSTSENDNV